MAGTSVRWVVLLCCWPVLAATPTARAEDEPAAVRSAKKLIESEAPWILFFAHPAGCYKGIACEGCRKAGDGFVLTYTLTWENIKKETLNPTFTFTFDADGVYQDCRRTAAG